MYLGLREILTECCPHNFQMSCQCKPPNWKRSWEQQESDGRADFDTDLWTIHEVKNTS